MFEWLRRLFRKLPQPTTRFCKLRWLSDVRRCVECAQCHRLSVVEADGRVECPACPHLEVRRPVGKRPELAMPYETYNRPVDPWKRTRASSRPPAAVVPIRPVEFTDSPVIALAATPTSSLGSGLLVKEIFESGGGGDFGGAGATGTWEETAAPAPAPEQQVCRAPEPQSYSPPPCDPPSDNSSSSNDSSTSSSSSD